MDSINNVWNTASQEMYSQAQGGQAQGGQEQSQAQPSDDGIQDVEYEEVIDK